MTEERSKGDPMSRALGRFKPDRNWYPENFDWYLKWFASILILISLAMRSAGVDYRMYDLMFGFVGIGAHAAVGGMAVLTRDASRYRTYFPRLKIIAPS